MINQKGATRILLPCSDKIFRICTVKLDINSKGEKLIKIAFPDLVGRQMVFGNETINSCFARGAFDTFQPEKVSVGCEMTYHFLHHDSHFKGEDETYIGHQHIQRNDDSPIEIAYVNLNDPKIIFSNYLKNPAQQIQLKPFSNQRMLNFICFPKRAKFHFEPIAKKDESFLGCYTVTEDDEWKITLFDYASLVTIPKQPPIYIQKPKVATDKILDVTDTATNKQDFIQL